MRELRYRVTLEFTQPVPPEAEWEGRMTKAGIRRAFNVTRWSFEEFSATLKVLEVARVDPEKASR